MEDNNINNFRNAKKRVKEIEKEAEIYKKYYEYQLSLFLYKKAYETADQWNLKKEKLKLTQRISELLKIDLKTKFDKHLEAAQKYEVKKEYKFAYDHLKAALSIASEQKASGIDEMTMNINKLEEKIKYIEIYLSKQILLGFYNGNQYKTPVLLQKALQIIDLLPDSSELTHKIIEFVNFKNQIILCECLSKNSWFMKIYSSKNPFYTLKYRYLTKKEIKIIIINFFKGYFIGDFLQDLENGNAQYQALFKIIDKIRKILEHHDTCEYCKKKFLNFGEERCEYCGIEIDYDKFLFSVLVDK